MTRSFRDSFRYFFLKVQAMLLLAFGRPAAALARFDRMVSSWPLDRYTLASRAHVLAGLNRLEASIISQQRVVGLPGSEAQMAVDWFNLGYLQQQAGRYDEARPSFEKATEFNPAMDRAWYGLALVLMHQQQFDEARQALKKNTALQPMSPHGWYRLAQVNLALGEPEKSRKVIDHLRQFEPRVAAQLEREISMAGALNEQTHHMHAPVPMQFPKGAPDALG
ncbi:tetratricopeptide (TPR) repeat protein [Polaromonas sp. CG_9.5]|nr:tetratricopeptide (TPR) repeat protein [Polaromonas sp. CG_9.5]